MQENKGQILDLVSNIKDSESLVNTIFYTKLEKTSKKQLLVDISSIINYDSKTGISRVVKTQLIELFLLNQDDYIIKAIYLKKIDENYYYFYAHEYMKNTLKLDIKEEKDEELQLSKNDIIYISDLATSTINIAKEEKIFDYFKNIGVKIVFLIYDLLPILYPHFFRENQDKIHQQYLEDITSISNYFITISQKVKKDLLYWIQKNSLKKDYHIQAIHLGADFKDTKNSIEEIKINKKNGSLDFLIISTIEPRKAHKQLLDAFKLLWSENLDLKLHIVGKKGWFVDDLINEINSSPKLNNNLFYYSFIDDSTLKNLYRKVDAVIIPSYDEGFGLPIIEAAFYQKPIICRDTEVFKEVAKENAFYFEDDTNPNTIYKSIKEWAKLYSQNIHPKTQNLTYLSWQENAKLTFQYLKSL